jgi:hypothetical protein
MLMALLPWMYPYQVITCPTAIIKMTSSEMNLQLLPKKISLEIALEFLNLNQSLLPTNAKYELLIQHILDQEIKIYLCDHPVIGISIERLKTADPTKLGSEDSYFRLGALTTEELEQANENFKMNPSAFTPLEPDQCLEDDMNMHQSSSLELYVESFQLLDDGSNLFLEYDSFADSHTCYAVCSSTMSNPIEPIAHHPISGCFIDKASAIQLHNIFCATPPTIRDVNKVRVGVATAWLIGSANGSAPSLLSNPITDLQSCYDTLGKPTKAVLWGYLQKVDRKLFASGEDQFFRKLPIEFLKGTSNSSKRSSQ